MAIRYWIFKSTTMLNACTKKSGNLLKAPRRKYHCIYPWLKNVFIFISINFQLSEIFEELLVTVIYKSIKSHCFKLDVKYITLIVFTLGIKYRNLVAFYTRCKMYKFLYIVKMVTLIGGNPKALFLIATILRCRGGLYSFTSIAPLYPWYVPYIAEC